MICHNNTIIHMNENVIVNGDLNVGNTIVVKEGYFINNDVVESSSHDKKHPSN